MLDHKAVVLINDSVKLNNLTKLFIAYLLKLKVEQLLKNSICYGANIEPDLFFNYPELNYNSFKLTDSTTFDLTKFLLTNPKLFLKTSDNQLINMALNLLAIKCKLNIKAKSKTEIIKLYNTYLTRAEIISDFEALKRQINLNEDGSRKASLVKANQKLCYVDNCWITCKFKTGNLKQIVLINSVLGCAMRHGLSKYLLKNNILHQISSACVSIEKGAICLYFNINTFSYIKASRLIHLAKLAWANLVNTELNLKEIFNIAKQNILITDTFMNNFKTPCYSLIDNTLLADEIFNEQDLLEMLKELNLKELITNAQIYLD